MKDILTVAVVRGLALGLALLAVGAVSTQATTASSLDLHWDRAIVQLDDAVLLLDRSTHAQNVRLFDRSGSERATLRVTDSTTVLFSHVNGERIYFDRPASASAGLEWLATQSYLLWRDLQLDMARTGRRGKGAIAVQQRGGYVRGERSSALEPPLAMTALEVTLGKLTVLAQREYGPILARGNTVFAARTARLYDSTGQRLGIARWFDDPRVFTWGMLAPDGGLQSSVADPRSVPASPGLVWMAAQLVERHGSVTECIVGPCTPPTNPPWPPGPGLPPPNDCSATGGWCPPECFDCTGPTVPEF